MKFFRRDDKDDSIPDLSSRLEAILKLSREVDNNKSRNAILISTLIEASNVMVVRDRKIIREIIEQCRYVDDN